MDNVGFIGLGVMGRQMAGNLAKDCVVFGYDVKESRFGGLQRVARLESIRELAEKCSTVCLSLPNADIVEQVTVGSDGLADNLSPASLVIDFSTTLPSVSRRVASRLGEKGIEFADAPVSGGEAGARNATLSIMVGSSEKTFERCKPYFSLVGKSIVRVGDVGAGALSKLVNNMIVGAAFAVIAEGFALAGQNGIDPAILYNAIRDGWAGSKVLDVSAQAMIAEDYTPGGTINMLEKDLGYARLVATESHIPIPITAMAHEVFVAAQATGKGNYSQPAIIALWRKLTHSKES